MPAKILQVNITCVLSVISPDLIFSTVIIFTITGATTVGDVSCNVVAACTGVSGKGKVLSIFTRRFFFLGPQACLKVGSC